MTVSLPGIERVTGTIGATVSGVDPRVDQPAHVKDALCRALHEHGVLFFSTGTPLDDAEHTQLAALFGAVRVAPDAGGAVSSQFVVLDSVLRPTDVYLTSWWHTDSTSEERPPQAAVLRPVQLPSVGGDTMWASMYAAYEALSSRYQRLLDGLEALHSTAAIRSYPGRPEDDPKLDQKVSSCIHPVIIKDPVTRRRMLYVNANFTERLVGFTDAESEKLLRMLYEHVNTPEFHVRLRWRPDTVAVWEERVTQHRAVLDYTEPRVMRRVTIEGDRPAA